MSKFGETYSNNSDIVESWFHHLRIKYNFIHNLCFHTPPPRIWGCRRHQSALSKVIYIAPHHQYNTQWKIVSRLYPSWLRASSKMNCKSLHRIKFAQSYLKSKIWGFWENSTFKSSMSAKYFRANIANLCQAIRFSMSLLLHKIQSFLLSCPKKLYNYW